MSRKIFRTLARRLYGAYGIPQGVDATVPETFSPVKGPDYHWDESKNPDGKCATDLQCDGKRTCTAGTYKTRNGSITISEGICKGTAR